MFLLYESRVCVVSLMTDNSTGDNQWQKIVYFFKKWLPPASGYYSRKHGKLSQATEEMFKSRDRDSFQSISPHWTNFV